jgi:hypothetical protein
MSPPGFGGWCDGASPSFLCSPAGRAVFPSIDAVVARMRPSDPLLCLRPAAIAGAALRFVELFPGDVLYAVKCNPEPRVLRALWAGGVRHFDYASLAEVALVRKLSPAAEVHFMHPVKSGPAIRDAFDVYGLTDFAFDSADELAKILQETVPVGLVGDPPVLRLFVRLALPKGSAVYDLSGKFGAPLEDAVELLSAAPARRPSRHRLSCRLAVPRARRICAGNGTGRRSDRELRRSGRHRRCRRRVPGQLPRHDAAAARRLHRGYRGWRRRAAGRCETVGRARAGARRGRPVGRRAGAAAA